MKRLFLADHFRGPDSTGLAAVRAHSRDMKIVKLNSHSLDLFEMGRFKEVLQAGSSSVFLGHNRAATRGAVSTYNAHPYIFKNIVGAHNGTLDYQTHLDLEGALGDKFAVDSQALYSAIAEFGIEDAISMCTEGRDSTTGAWSLVWYDQSENSLNFLRNQHRPLWYAFTEDFDHIFWASEYPMIDVAIKLSGQYKLFKDDKGMSFWSTEPDLHFKWDVDALRKGGAVVKPVVKKIKGKEPKPVVTTVSTGPFPRVAGASTTCGTTTPRGAGGQSGSSTKGRILVKSLAGTTIDPFAGVLRREGFNAMAEDGCAWCAKPMMFESPGTLVYEREGVALCADCSGARPDIVGVPVSRVFATPASFDANL